jgi:hypothetical protein
MNWYIPDLEPYFIYAWQEFTRWSGANLFAVLIITNILTALKVSALKSKNTVDDKIISLLIYVFSFKWLKALGEKKPE